MARKSPTADLATSSERIILLVVLDIAVILVLLSAFLAKSNDRLLESLSLYPAGIGTSMLASVLFYGFYASFAERRILASVAERASQDASNLFLTHFKDIVPAKVYPPDDNPSPQFEADHAEALRSSLAFRIKAVTGRNTAVDIAMQKDRSYLGNKAVTLLLVHPRSKTALREAASHRIAKRSAASTAEHNRHRLDQGLVQREMDVLREEIFVTLVGLYDLRDFLIEIRVGFYTDYAFFRSEIMDEALFLTFYLEKRFPGRYLYTHGTTPYRAFYTDFLLNEKHASPMIHLKANMTEQAFTKHLRNLNCRESVDSLRQKARELRKEVEANPAEASQ